MVKRRGLDVSKKLYVSKASETSWSNSFLFTRSSPRQFCRNVAPGSLVRNSHLFENTVIVPLFVVIRFKTEPFTCSVLNILSWRERMICLSLLSRSGLKGAFLVEFLSICAFFELCASNQLLAPAWRAHAVLYCLASTPMASWVYSLWWCCVTSMISRDHHFVMCLFNPSVLPCWLMHGAALSMLPPPSLMIHTSASVRTPPNPHTEDHATFANEGGGGSNCWTLHKLLPLISFWSCLFSHFEQTFFLSPFLCIIIGLTPSLKAISNFYNFVLIPLFFKILWTCKA